MKASFGRLCCLSFVFILFCGNLQAQKLSKYYNSLKQEDGMLYFIEALKEFKTETGNDFIYDLSYLDSSDSLTLNFTFYNEKIIDVEQITLQTSFISTTAKAKKIFIKDNSGDWEHRYTANFSFKTLHEFYRGKEATFIIQPKDHEGITIHANKRKWKKQSGAFLRIFDMIVANKDVD